MSKVSFEMGSRSKSKMEHRPEELVGRECIALSEEIFDVLRRYLCIELGFERNRTLSGKRIVFSRDFSGSSGLLAQYIEEGLSKRLGYKYHLAKSLGILEIKKGRESLVTDSYCAIGTTIRVVLQVLKDL